MLITTWLFILMTVLVFTVCGWRVLLMPVGRVLIPLHWRTLMFLVWTGFAGAVLMMPVTYRTFGWDLSDVLLAPVPELREKHRRDREENYNPSGMHEPGWRQRAGLPPLPRDWDGTGPHLLPRWSAVPVGASLTLLIMLLAGHRRARARSIERWPGRGRHYM